MTSKKKAFDTTEATERMFTKAETEQEQGTNTQAIHKEDTNNTQTVNKRKPFRKYRYNLLLDDDLDAFLHKISYDKRTSMTQYINELLRREKEEYLKNGGTLEGWEK